MTLARVAVLFVQSPGVYTWPAHGLPNPGLRVTVPSWPLRPLKNLSKIQRAATPPNFARWLVEMAAGSK
jgi:hypothetical protein